MGKWFPRIYDTAMKPLEKNKFNLIRKSLVEQAYGRVLEVGSGTGINFPYYKNVTRLDAIEPNPRMQEKAIPRVDDASIPIQTYTAGAEKLPFDDNTFDSVVATLVFCTIPDPVAALREIRRVAKPGARMLFFEHVKMDQPALAKAQSFMTPVWKQVCDGCHLDRDTLGLLQDSSLEILKINRYYRGLFLSIVVNNQPISY
ncbi:class I SAM-dependent methyltransferase [Virgibacillus kekensis]|uniref:Class I SAM-dependent methyltransferase n=1 Tax=Virgibacillus kekensis TaxID=202261 RepID=A0ABV9DMN2_9BACI